MKQATTFKQVLACCVFSGISAISFTSVATAQDGLAQTVNRAVVNTDCVVQPANTQVAGMLATRNGQRGVPLGDELATEVGDDGLNPQPSPPGGEIAGDQLATEVGDDGLNPQPSPPRDMSAMRRLARTGGLRVRNAGDAGLNPQPSPPEGIDVNRVGLNPQPSPPEALDVGRVGLNPQPSPPETLDVNRVGLNPQPSPPEAMTGCVTPTGQE